MTSWRGERTRWGGPDSERETVVRQGESGLSVVPQCVLQIQDLEIIVKEWDRTHSSFFGIRAECVCVRVWGGVPLMEVSFFCPGFDVKGSCSCFDRVVCRAVFNIHAADQEERAERRFLVKQKANLQLRQFSLRLFLLLGKWAGRLGVCIIHTHVITRTQSYAPMVCA